MRRKTAAFRIFLVLTAAAVVLCSCAQSRVPKRIEQTEAAPVQAVIDGVTQLDVQTWRSAFLPAYDSAVEAQEIELGTCTDYNAYLLGLLEEAAYVRSENYGENPQIELVDVTVTYIDKASRPDLFEDFKDIFTLRYRLDVDSIEQVAEVRGTLNMWGAGGSQSATSSDAVYITVMFDGKWYLHPVFYNLMY